MGREQYTLTAQNEKYWHAAAFYSFPCILAYEYKKLQNLLLEQDGLGSLLKLKDIFEVLLKFPANIVLCSAFESAARQIANNKVNKESSLFRLVAAALGTQNGMTLGNWIELVKRFGSSLKNKINIDQTLLGELILDAPENKEILELAMTASLKVRRFIENNGVVGWRNEQIGHGASKHRDSEELITDIIDKTEKLKALMESLESEYDRLQLYTDSDILLSGYEISIQEYVNTNSFKIVDRETKSALFR